MKSKEYVWYCPSANVIGVADGDFIYFYWNGEREESYFPVLAQKGYWHYIGEL